VVYGFAPIQTVMPPAGWARSFAVIAMLALAFLICAQDADARLKSEWRFGGSMSHNYVSRPGTAAVLGEVPARGGSGFAYAELASFPGGMPMGSFSRPGPIGGFIAGFLGTGVFGLLFGHGILGGLSGVESFLGLALQITLIVMLGRLIRSWWHITRSVTVADLSPRQLADAYGRTRNEVLPDIDPFISADAPRDEPRTEAFKNR
jgi:hypothetical protein